MRVVLPQQGLPLGLVEVVLGVDDQRPRVPGVLEEQLKEAEETVQQYERLARTTLDEQRKRMRDSILEEIRAALVVKAKKDGFAMVIDTASETVNNTPVVLFTNNENDVTQAVLDQLNANAPVELPKTEEKSDSKKIDDKKTEKKQ